MTCFFSGLIAEWKRAGVNRYYELRFQLFEGRNRLFRIHMHFPFSRWLVSTDRQEGNFGRQTIADVAKPVEIRAITAVVNRAGSQPEVETAKASMPVV